MSKFKDIQVYDKDFFLLDKDLSFCIITAIYNWDRVFVQHKDRKTWEIPGGHKNGNETAYTCAERELKEETWAKIYDIDHWGYLLLVDEDWNKSYWALYFAQIVELGDLDISSEISQIQFFDKMPQNLTYPDDYWLIQQKAIEYRNYVESGKDYEDEEKEFKRIEKERGKMSKEEQNKYSAREIILQKVYIRDMEELLDAERDIQNFSF